MEFLKWYLIIGVIVNVIFAICKAKMNGYRGGDIIKNFNIFEIGIIYCGVFVLGVIFWLPAIAFDIVYVITGRLNK